MEGYTKSYTVKIRPLTPIWTGDADRQNTTLRETGIIGSLRWWYEALIRGLGGTACDPTSDHRCQLSGKEKTERERISKMCPACYLFGCTGWARKFRLEINEVNKFYAPFVIAKPEDSKKPFFLGFYDKSGKEFEENGGLMGEYELNFNVEEDKLDLIKLLLLLSTKWGFGSGVQKGFGIANINEEIKFSIEKNTFLKQNIFKSIEINNKLPLPQIDKFFFYRIPFRNESISEIKEKIGKNIYKTMSDLYGKRSLNNIFSNYSYIPTSPWVRCSIRRLFKDVLRRFIMGFVGDNKIKPIHLDCWRHSIVKDNKNKNKYYCQSCNQSNIDEKDILDKTGSKIYVSHIYKKNKEPFWEMKIWGWIPDLPEKIGEKRENVKNLLQSNIKSDEFWEKIFDTKENPVIVEKIWEKWDIDPCLLLNNRGEFYE